MEGDWMALPCVHLPRMMARCSFLPTAVHVEVNNSLHRERDFITHATTIIDELKQQTYITRATE